MTDHPRQPEGIPTGGQWVAKGHTEASGVTLTDVVELPKSSDVDEALHRGVVGLIDTLDGSSTENVIDLLDHDEDQLVAAFGEGPVNWLAGLKVTADVDSWETAKATYVDPSEWSSGGSVRVEDASGIIVAEVDFNGEDEPDLPDLLRRCPVDAAGRPLADLSDPGWERLGNSTGAVRAAEWRCCGFHTPEAALEWRGAGFNPEGAAAWDSAGFSAHEARGHRTSGLGVGAAVRLRASSTDPTEQFDEGPLAAAAAGNAA